MKRLRAVGATRSRNSYRLQAIVVRSGRACCEKKNVPKAQIPSVASSTCLLRQTRPVIPRRRRFLRRSRESFFFLSDRIFDRGNDASACVLFARDIVNLFALDDTCVYLTINRRRNRITNWIPFLVAVPPAITRKSLKDLSFKDKSSKEILISFIFPVLHNQPPRATHFEHIIVALTKDTSLYTYGLDHKYNALSIYCIFLEKTVIKAKGKLTK